MCFYRVSVYAVFWLLVSCSAFARDVTPPSGQQPRGLHQQLLDEGVPSLVRAARQSGDPQRGAIIFFQPYAACTKCHVAGQGMSPLGPDLAKREAPVTDDFLVESVLEPSKKIRKGYESVIVLTDDGKTITGLLVDEDDEKIVVRDVAKDGQTVTIAKTSIEQQRKNPISIMPAGLMDFLTSRQQFLDLARYLMEIAEGGPLRAAELEPPPSLYAAPPLPEYENRVDHAGMISDWNNDSFKRGEAIYNRLCINCHGTKERPGSLPTSRRFAQDPCKNGSDPYSMYQTLTKGFGMMVPQTWMVPQQKYDVIHYVREAYLKEANPSQYVRVDADYLAGLPKGDTRGPKPSNVQPWSRMDYGNRLTHSYEIGRDGSNIAYKGIAVRLDPGPGGISQGKRWMVYDHDTMRLAAAWSGKGFIDWNGIMFNGRHAIHPRVSGDVAIANPTAPGWANPADGSWTDTRIRGRDDRHYGPLPREWSHFRGLYQHGNQTVLSYTVGTTSILETPGVGSVETTPVFSRTFNIGPRDRSLNLQVANFGSKSADDRSPDAIQPRSLPSNSTSHASVVYIGADSASPPKRPDLFRFDGATSVRIDNADVFDMTDADYTITARIRTNAGGTVFCKTALSDKWVHDGKTFFIRGGRLVFDIGWVGQVQSRGRVADGRWHDVAMTWNHASGMTRLYIDGRADGDGVLKPKDATNGHVARIGFTADNFPRPQSFFRGDLQHVRFYQRVLSRAEIAEAANDKRAKKGLVANWDLKRGEKDKIRDLAGQNEGIVQRGAATGASTGEGIVAGVAGSDTDFSWSASASGDLRLEIPAGPEPLRFTLWMTNCADSNSAGQLAAAWRPEKPRQDLSKLTKGGPRRWSNTIETKIQVGDESGPFAVDVLTHPVNNPWFCRTRFTGFDFYPDRRRIAVCSWDGDVWLVTVDSQDDQKLIWQRIASGLFQPLGLKVIDERIHITCRDQLVILHDLNGDGETDFYENFNSDHQVTEHFHEFAMGLQTDAEGNFYYAKSARHALPALVPHHGTLLRISPDGSRTDILATGFRAANGVCLNPDGTFIVTDQEGHWNPKNRINYVHEGGFYGNMYGYHDVTDSSDDAMEQPLCWITNSFDRSPAELLWVDSDAWGPLKGSLLNLSYGYGKIYVVPHEIIDGQPQGGMCQLPIPQFPTGLVRGRFSPHDGQLYTCGMFAWAGSQSSPGGFYRIRYAGKPVFVPIELEATHSGMKITFSGEIDATVAADPSRYRVKTWDLRRTASYGSKHYNETSRQVKTATVASDRKSVDLEIEGIEPTWGMEVSYTLKSSGGEVFRGTIHNTIHRLPE